MVLLVALIQENVQFGKQKNTQKFKIAEKGGC